MSMLSHPIICQNIFEYILGRDHTIQKVLSRNGTVNCIRRLQDMFKWRDTIVHAVTSSSLSKYLGIHTGKNVFVVFLSIMSQDLSSEHLRHHTGERVRPYSSKTCGKSFVMKWRM